MGFFVGIEGYESLYAIDKSGEILHLKFYRTLKINYSTVYPSLNLSKNGVRETKLIHRLLATAFIPNPENKPQVNHKNGIKKDFSLTNLEWSTGSENCKHAYDTGLAKVSEHCKKVLSEIHSGKNHYNSKKVIHIGSGDVYDTIREAAKKNNIPVQTLHRKLHSENNNTGLKFYQQ